jgi:hypothetical protein
MRMPLAFFVATALAGCAQNDFSGSLFYLKPYKIEDLSCEELKKRLSYPTTRLGELRELRRKAAGGAGGDAIGALVYGPEEETNTWNKRMFEEEAARKNCAPENPLPLQ